MANLGRSDASEKAVRARHRLGAAVGAAAVGAMLLFFGSAGAAPGDLDPTFGTDGVVQTTVGAWGSGATTLLLQPDGKIVLGGWRETRTALARYLPDGTLDPSFGSGGIVQGPSIQDVSDGALQSDGKIVLSGSAANFRFTLVRFNPDGSVDTAFGAGGYATGPAGSAMGVAVQPDGRIVVVGSDYSNSYVLTRFRADGVTDTTFGTDGVVRTRIGEASAARAVLLQGDGKIVAAGESYARAYSSPSVMALARYLPDGALDTGFGSDGTSTAAPGVRSASASSIALQPDGRIVLAGTADDQIGVARFLQNGSLDTSFSADGTVTTPVGPYGRGQGVAVQTDGRILAAGSGVGGMTVVRYEPDGRLDRGFGNGGVVTTDAGLYSSANSVAVQTDGRILAAGGADQAFALVRYLVTTPSTIAAQPPVVDYGLRVRLSGTLTSRQAGTVEVLQQACAEGSRSPSTTTSAAADGTWSASVPPGSRTVYWAGVGLERSSPVTIRVRPKLTLKRVGAHSLRVRALFGVSLAGEGVVLQRHTKARGWIDYRYRTLRRVTTSDSGVVSGATFPIARQPGRRLRLVLLQDGLFDCFAGSASRSMRD